MAETKLTFGEWLPDLPGATGALTQANNVIPLAVGYGPLPAAESYSNAASESLRGVAAGQWNGEVAIFAGGPSKLFKYNGTNRNLDNVSKTGGYTANYSWDFTQFGNAMIAANGADKLQVWNIGSSSAFADLSADAPAARYVTVVRDFVVGARGNSQPNRVYWSDINNETNWTSGPTSQADIQDIAEGGSIVGLTGGEFGLVLLERSIVRMTYIGAPLFFQFDNISRGLGCYAAGSVAQYGGLTFFLSDDGFYVCDGQTVKPIGTEKVDRWFFRDANPSGLDSMSAAVDPVRNCVVWCYQNQFGSQSVLIYNWQIGRWSHGSTTASFVADAATPSVTLEGLDSYGTIDSLTTALDSRLWVGGRLLLAGSEGAKVITFTGQPMTAQIATGDLGGMNSLVMLARPIVQDGTASVAVCSRQLLSQPIAYGTAVAADAENRVSLRSAGRWHRIQVNPSGDSWSAAVGCDIDVAPQGRR